MAAHSNGEESIPLPVLDPQRRVKRGTIGPWRAGVLITVQLAIVAHIIHWLVSDTTLGAVEPSEAMYTLEAGRLTAGAIFLGLTIISVLIAGRYMCGWLCHIVALQDFCHWLMGKAGIRPKPFRSRLLMFVPLILGLYMFVWPSFKRLALQPAVEAAGFGWPWWLRRAEPFYGIENELFVENMWANMPEWYVAVPFLLICGFATVYFLGAKAFCTYACPYGGLFAVMEPAAPVRVRVDHDKCKGCAQCTAACTSNVRVHEEIKAFGMVVDPGCMKTMDCISACPNDALSISPGRPAYGAKVRDEAKDDYARASARRASRYD
ncbi:MAG: 4Fe-4S binding protein, partial [Phycisphaerales bacterium]|nr:4Fe-4S binding protein [Phycisphaerales bacterium]